VAPRVRLSGAGRDGDQLIRFADVHPFDTEILEYAGTLVGPEDPHRGDLTARPAHAYE
jgi:hypothetical protein